LARLNHVTLQNLPLCGGVGIEKISAPPAWGRKSIIWQLFENTSDIRLVMSIFA
jgi:hypothetical protein